jgi:hypothetical protein
VPPSLSKIDITRGAMWLNDEGPSASAFWMNFWACSAL